ncbi:MAG: WYL domain-containing protein [Patescibacteria group bacterium]
MPRVGGKESALVRHFNLLAEAIAHRRAVRLHYYAATSGATTEYRMDPYHLRFEAGAWYLIGYCHLRQDLRIFALDRIRALEFTGDTFERASGFTIEQYLGLSWGIERGPEHLVRVAFDAEQARWIKERIWHAGQKLSDLNDGGVVLEARVSGLEPFKRWILGFGRHARVLEPRELAEAVRREAEGIMRLNK